MSTQGEPLTRHPEGSLRELLRISLPLVLSFLSGSVMFFCDRWILAKYSREAMNAAAISGMTFYVFAAGALGVASISEVFVGQHNGAGHHKRIGQPVWQMIYFSILTAIVFVPIGFWGGGHLLTSENHIGEGIPYFQFIMYGGPFHAAFAGISGFYIGRGRVMLITCVSIFGQVLNGVLDWILVFGLDPWIPSMGAKGAAIATTISMGVQAGLLFAGFMQAKYREQFGTGNMRFHFDTFWQCLKIGFPASIGHMVEIAIGAYLAAALASLSEDHITVLAVGQNFFVVFMFTIEGLQKGLIAVVSNFIGGHKWDLIPRTLWAAMRVLLGITALLSLPMVFFSEPLIMQFLRSEGTAVVSPELILACKTACIGVWLYFLFDGFTWIIAGVLVSAGDTRFVMIMNAVATFLFAGLPIHYFVIVKGGSPDLTWLLYPVYAFMNGLCFYLRYRWGTWKELHIIEET